MARRIFKKYPPSELTLYCWKPWLSRELLSARLEVEEL